MTSPRQKRSVGRVESSDAIEFARLVAQGLSDDLRRLHADLMEEESRLTALEEIRRHSMRDFEALSDQGVTTVEAALYYTLFHHLSQEITIQGRLVLNARHRVTDKQTAVRAAREDLAVAERVRHDAAIGGRPAAPGARRGRWAPHGPALKKAS
jgi:hypothetical protein